MLRASRPLIHLHRAVYPEIQSSNIVLLCALLAVEPPPLSLLVRVAGWGRRPSRERCRAVRDAQRPNGTRAIAGRTSRTPQASNGARGRIGHQRQTRKSS